MGKITCTLLASCFVFTFGAIGQDVLKTESVSVFKNGSAFFVKKGAINTTEGTYFLEGDAPKAAFGTLWFSASDGEIESVKTHSLITERITNSKKEFKSSAFGPMLEANIRKELTLYLYDDQTLTGKVEKIDQDYFLFNTGAKWVNLKLSSIQRIEFKEKPTFPDSTRVVSDTVFNEKNGLLIDFSSNKKAQELGMMYLQKGIGWVPTYSLDLLTEETAQLRLQAVVTNHAEAFTNTNLNFVVGVPNFMHLNDVTPLSMNNLESINAFNNAISAVSNGLVSDFANRGGGRITYGIENSSGFSQTEGSGLDGISSEDLFFYNLPNVSLKLGESAQFTILQMNLGVKHIYEVELEGNTSDFYYYQQLGTNSGFVFGENFKNKVWHSVKFSNASKSPLTAGSVMVTNSEGGVKRPVSQDRITYTPAGGETFLKLTVAPDVSVRDGEKQIKAEERIKQEDGYWYDKFTIEGQVVVQNYKSKKIDLNVKKVITGELEKSDENWLTSKRVRNARQQNDVTDVCWELSLKPGEKRTINYTYTVLVRR